MNSSILTSLGAWYHLLRKSISKYYERVNSYSTPRPILPKASDLNLSLRYSHRVNFYPTLHQVQLFSTSLYSHVLNTCSPIPFWIIKTDSVDYSFLLYCINGLFFFKIQKTYRMLNIIGEVNIIYIYLSNNAKKVSHDNSLNIIG